MKASTTMPADGSSDKPADPGQRVVDVDAISLEIERIRVLLDMASEKFDAIHAQVGTQGDGVWLSFEEYLNSHLAAIERAIAKTGMTAPQLATATKRQGSLTDLIAAYRQAYDAFDEDDQATIDQADAAIDALRAARPTDPAELAAQLRWLFSKHGGDDLISSYRAPLSHIAAQLEALAASAEA